MSIKEKALKELIEESNRLWQLIKRREKFIEEQEKRIEIEHLTGLKEKLVWMDLNHLSIDIKDFCAVADTIDDLTLCIKREGVISILEKANERDRQKNIEIKKRITILPNL